MKGLTIVTLMLIITLLVATAGFLVYVLFGSAELSTKQQARLTAEQVAGIINMMQASPSTAMHTLELQGKCTIVIQPPTVTVTIEKKLSTAGIIKTDVNIRPADLKCEKTGRIYFIRCPDYIEVAETQNKKKCES